MALNMPADASLDADIMLFEGLLNGPDSALLELTTNQHDIRSAAEARSLVADILVGLRSARDEPLFTTEQMQSDLDRRIRERRDAA
jgi:hypothetical protein